MAHTWLQLESRDISAPKQDYSVLECFLSRHQFGLFLFWHFPPKQLSFMHIEDLFREIVAFCYDLKFIQKALGSFFVIVCGFPFLVYVMISKSFLKPQEPPMASSECLVHSLPVLSFRILEILYALASLKRRLIEIFFLKFILSPHFKQFFCLMDEPCWCLVIMISLLVLL